MQLTFLGATGTVTGSKYLFEYQDKKIMIDCGLFQGLKELRARNRDPLPVNPATIDAVILTHAHIDHSGYIPILVKNGFTGPVYCTEATYDLCKILLPDSGHIHEEDAKRANRHGYSKHSPALPLYTYEEALLSLEQFKIVDNGTPEYISEDLHFNFSRAGHILGAAFVTLKAGNKSINFSGDLGRPDDPVMKPPVQLPESDYLLIESTYGDRLHDNEDPCDKIAAAIKQTSANGGTILIPSFAVGRTQTILYYIHKLKQSGSIPDIPVFVDSPMATNATKLMCKHHKEHKLTEAQSAKVCNTAVYTRTVKDSKALASNSMPKVIISASGMAEGGRILHHLKNLMGSPQNTILFTGFQAAGTRGEAILNGEKLIKIHGHKYKLRAHVENIANLSAHADYSEILNWLGHFRKPPKHTFITHGDPAAAESLKQKIEENLGWDVSIPAYLDSYNL